MDKTTAATHDWMKSEEPKSTEIPMKIPDKLSASDADREANTSGAPAPNANNVTPAKLSDSLKVFDIYYKLGAKYSSAVVLKK
eukprot:CAMPEP_0176347592 /NCGR_PEP_ID=MMETSP0126-20121128/7182_1 /TAXON_ID=141414 ORGANISM="Strombidinopsis acuminatum, Strain SPMC142" /NCGR_SAMPLE_ID=MMETSP0126 /ASSEMBLY_ACC=CAM_ASM_000229 /LENGTH=82 /DNA_ID=CAMNT_0017695863 /DNA_START=1560 /DNA_END=1808 /DNA_ORIENTATION=-